MSIYAIGDIQGCLDELLALIDQLQFDPTKDQLWFVGDLVNRGPKSLETLRFVKSLGKAAVTVLGNHDLHLLALVHGNHREKKPGSLASILVAPDRDELLHWLRFRPLLHEDTDKNFAMIHAGLPPQWSMKTARACAREMEAILQGANYRQFFKAMYGDEPKCWDRKLASMDRLRFITNAFTRLRYCTDGGELALKQKGPPGSQPAGHVAWFDHPKRKTTEQRIVFGHWSTLGYHASNNVWALDSGCLWGGQLTALRLRKKKQPKAHHLQCTRQVNPARFS